MSYFVIFIVNASPSKLTKGFLWSAVERFSVQGVQFLLSIIIARLVMPSDYGLIAMMSIFLAIAQSFVDSGMTQALIHKKDCNDVDYSTAFYFNIFIAVLAYMILFLLSPLISIFYKQPELEIILKFASLNIIINAFGLVQRSKFTRKVDFKTQSKASLISVVLSGFIGLSLAYYGYGVWALVFQSISSSFTNTLLLWFFSSWKPLWTFSYSSLKQLYGFGVKLLLTGLLSTIYTNIYSLIIGKFYNSASLGLYNRAYTLSSYPSSNITNIISRVVYPVECKLQNDDEKLRITFFKIIGVSSYIVFPIMFGIVALSKPFVMVVLSSRWAGASEYLAITSFALMWNHVMFLNWQILSVKGRTDLSLKSEIIKKLCSLVILVCSIPLGVKAMCWGMVMYSFFDMAIIIYFLKKINFCGYKDEIRVLFPVFLLSVLMCCIIKIVNYFISSYLIQLLLGILVGATIYVCLSYLFDVWEFDVLLKKIKNIKK